MKPNAVATLALATAPLALAQTTDSTTVYPHSVGFEEPDDLSNLLDYRLPDWSYDRIDMPRYLRRTFLGRRTVAAHTSYGCPHFCNFCAVVNLVGGRWRAQSAERVAGVFETYHRRWGVDAVELVDNNFFVDERRVADFSDRVKHLGMAWWGEGRVDTLLRYDDASLRAMRDAGLKMIFLGAESGSAETLERMDKGGRLVPGMTLELVEKLGGRPTPAVGWAMGIERFVALHEFQNMHRQYKEGIHQFVMGGYIREFPADFLKHFGIHVTPVAQGIALGDQAYLAFAGLAIQCPEAAGAALLNTFSGPFTSLFKAVPFLHSVTQGQYRGQQSGSRTFVRVTSGIGFRRQILGHGNEPGQVRFLLGDPFFLQ